MNDADKLRTILARRDATIVPGAFNALSARLIEDQGFEAIYVTGAGLSNAYLGAPDIGLFTVTELAANLAVIRDSVELPLIVDADTGFGNAVNTIRSVKTLERAGAAALQIEDQVFPKKCGHFTGKAIIPLTEARAKIRAAADARDNALIIARTDALALEGIDAAIERANLFVEDGADVIFVEAPKTLEEMKYISDNIRAPLVANMVIGGVTPIATREVLAECGYSLCLYANAALQSAILGINAALVHLKQKGSITEADGVTCTFEARQAVVKKHEYDALEARYAGA